MDVPVCRVMLLLPTTTYRARDLLAAATRMNVEVVVASDRRQALESHSDGATVTVDLGDPEAAARQIEEHHRARPLAAVLGVDEETLAAAAAASARLGLPHNAPAAIAVSRDKHALRVAQRAHDLPCPWFELASVRDAPGRIARGLRYPCVLKPTFLSASRGVIRADDEQSFVEAFARIAELLSDPAVLERGGDAAGTILIEQYLPGLEYALEGILIENRLRVLALFDKPDPLVGPTFEETLYVTPARVSTQVSDRIVDAVDAVRVAIGLVHGPIHAEVRVAEDGTVFVIEVAARTIGGLCGRALSFGAGASLEELVIAQALGRELPGPLASAAAGAMMIPIPRAGILDTVDGIDAARAVAGIEDVEISIRPGQRVVPLPEGDRYLGFIFARAATPDDVERALRAAHDELDVRIDADGSSPG